MKANNKLIKTFSNLLIASALAVPFAVVGDLNIHTSNVAHAGVNDIVQMSENTYIEDAQKMLNKINNYRISKGLKPVNYSVQLSQIVQNESDKQITKEDYGHSESFLKDYRAGRYTSANEIIALSYSYRDIDSVFNFWVGSPAHNKALLNPNHEVIGIGITYADGSLEKTGKPWRILSTVNMYGYKYGGTPADSSTTVKESFIKTSPNNQYQIINGFKNLYNRDGGFNKFNKPKSNEMVTTGGGYQLYDNHTFFWSSHYNTSESIYESGAIGKFWRAKGAEHNLGMPINKESGHNGNYYQLLATPNGQRTMISWRADTGIKTINANGGIYWAWLNNGGIEKFGVPVTNEYSIPGGGAEVKFANGSTFTWYPHTGTKIS